MPRLPSPDNLEKIVSTKISKDDYDFLRKYAKLWYNMDKLEQPTVSHMLRLIVKIFHQWCKSHPDSKYVEPESETRGNV